MPSHSPEKNAEIPLQMVWAVVTMPVHRPERKLLMAFQTVSATERMPSHSPEKNSVIPPQMVWAVLTIPVHRPERNSLMPFQTAWAVEEIASHNPEKKSPMPPQMVCAKLTMASQAPWKKEDSASHAAMAALLMASHSPIQNSRKPSQLFQRATKMAIRAAMAATTSPMGFAASSVNKPVTAVLTTEMTGPILDTTERMVPTAEITLPMTMRTGPTAATIRPMVTMVCLVPSSRLFSQSTKDWMPATMFLMTGMSSSPMEMARPSRADFRMVSWPWRLSSCVSAICWAAPPLSVMDCWRVSQLSPVLARRALTAARSVLLKMVAMMFDFSAAVMPSIEVLRSPSTSLRERIFPSESYTSTPSCSMQAAALSVGFCRDRMTLRKCVPPSAPLMPLLARMPRAVFNSAVPPLTLLAVAPIVRMASPSWATEVFVVEEVLAIWSTIVVASSVPMPKADMASVTMSEAEARSMPPAAARLRTVGSVSHISWVS